MAAEGGFAETRFAISASQTTVVVAVAVIAGALASVLPGRRAARARPVEAPRRGVSWSKPVLRGWVSR